MQEQKLAVRGSNNNKKTITTFNRKWFHSPSGSFTLCMYLVFCCAMNLNYANCKGVLSEFTYCLVNCPASNCLTRKQEDRFPLKINSTAAT